MKLSSSNHPSDLLRGLWLPVRAARLILRTPALLRWSRICAVVTALCLMAWLAALVLWTDDAVATLWPKPAGDLGRLAWMVAVAVAFCLLGVLGATTLPLLLLAPLLDPISELTEMALGSAGDSTPSGGWRVTARGAAVALGHSLKRVALLWVGQLALLPLFLVPGFGSGLSALLGVAWTSLWLAAEYLDLPMARHLHSFQEVLSAMASRKLAAAGFGLSLYILLWVPVVNLFLIPIAAVAGTIFYHSLRDSEVPNRGRAS